MDIRKSTNRRIKRLVRFALSAVIAILGIIIAPASLSAGGSNPNDLIIVVNKSVNLDRLSIDQVRNYFLKTKLSWPGGEKAIAINSRDAKLREAFRNKVLFMNAVEEKRFWKDEMIRTGKQAPPEFGDPLKAVFRIKGAIGYVYRKDFSSKVAKTVLVIPAA